MPEHNLTDVMENLQAVEEKMVAWRKLRRVQGAAVPDEYFDLEGHRYDWCVAHHGLAYGVELRTRGALLHLCYDCANLLTIWLANAVMHGCPDCGNADEHVGGVCEATR